MRAALIAVLVTVATLSGGCSRQEAAWQDARGVDSAAAYREYLRDFPAGTHAAEARERLEWLIEQDHWSRALRLGTPEAFQRFLAGNPDGRHAREARERLKAFVESGQAPPPPASPEAADAWVQVGAFGRGAAAAEAAWPELLDRHSDLLVGLAPEVEFLAREGEPLWRLVAGPVAVSRATGICEALVSRGDTCLVVRR